MTFTLAIIGRPNVGKSTLFNRLVGKRIALVDDTPGVTRDRREGDARLHDLSFTVFDTAGIEESPSESMTGRMRAQTEAAMQAADVLALVVDARTGLLPADRTLADMARRTGKPVLVLANKVEGRAGGAGATEAFALGLGEPIAISAEHGEGMADLRDALAAIVGAGDDEDDEDAARDPRTRPIRVAIVGRPNAGKSTLVNCILGEERLLTGPEAGLTRDSITVPLEWGGRAFELVDTAGLRRRSRVEEKLEKLSVAETLRAIRLAEVVVVVMDVRTPFEEQDLRIVDLVEQEGRALVLAMTKWDVAERKTGAISRLRTDADHWLPQVKGVPLVAVSGLTGEGVDRLRLAVIDAFTVWNRRLPTSGLNRWFSAMLQAHAPPAVSGRSIKLNYVTQAKSRPPTFVIFCSRADAVPESYRRYLVNGLRETFDLPGTPIRLVLREKANPFAGRRKRR